ncbi:hypothetical protein L226DRAFT_243106 [Lentinus tigrinus ALCF2SS1-7]|uniref:Uncharacterized protein n=1 Tax=Lentinus tigrinus ALCF2SS1-6 TaxID=1328759 RepID=A0A5C2SPZ9_9APHY|nr:hypothetical protein L227DRAFT_649523 [Lentinus tigrinus ALCF2SS1-6]RPD79177.1 hypothetical protein L226DRAFT_243106 [Lentinus tigrinus ALCF2SS1-7]
MPAALTPHAAAAFKNHLNYHICVESPVMRIESLERCAETELFGFRKGLIADLSDGAGGSEFVLLPVDYQVFGAHRGGFQDGRTLSVGDVVRIERMVRLPASVGSSILVYSMELCNGEDDGVELLVTKDEDGEAAEV